MLFSRYVSFTVTGTNPALSPVYYGERFDLSISNTVLNATGTTGTYTLSNMYTAHEMTGGSFATWSQHTFMFDTENNTTHNITITFSSPSGTDAFYVDWFAGWNSNSTLNNVLVMSVPKWQFRVDFKNDNETKVTDIRRVGFNKSIANLCNTLRTTFFIPVYLVDLSESSFGGLQSDGLHPSYFGQKYIANRVLNVISNGEYNFTS
jgi:hypothetical protein